MGPHPNSVGSLISAKLNSCQPFFSFRCSEQRQQQQQQQETFLQRRVSRDRPKLMTYFNAVWQDWTIFENSW